MRGLQHAECTTALVGGVNMVFDAVTSAQCAVAGMTSREGSGRGWFSAPLST